MGRFLTRCAALFALLVYPLGMRAASPETVSTHCRESEVALDPDHTATRLGRCGEGEGENVLWHLDRIDQIGGGLDGHFTRRNRGAGVVVYVMDTGVMASHDEFDRSGVSRVIAGFDVAGSVPLGGSTCRSANKALDPCYLDFMELSAASHGTSVASLIAGDNVGVAPDASIVSIRVMNEHGLATTRSYLDGLDMIIQHAWATSPDSRQTAIINISGWVLDRLTNTSAESSTAVTYDEVQRKIEDMIAGVDVHGIPDPLGKKFLFVVAGNNRDGGCGRDGVVDRFPAILGPDLKGFITVGGMTEANTSWEGSCKGGVEVLAPAVGIFSATITARDEYRGRRPNLRSGTSFAAPIIAGIAALMIADHPDATPQELEVWIESTPSRVARPDQRYADGKVACLPPADVLMAASRRALLAPANGGSASAPGD